MTKFWDMQGIWINNITTLLIHLSNPILYTVPCQIPLSHLTEIYMADCSTIVAQLISKNSTKIRRKQDNNTVYNIIILFFFLGLNAWWLKGLKNSQIWGGFNLEIPFIQFPGCRLKMSGFSFRKPQTNCDIIGQFI